MLSELQYEIGKALKMKKKTVMKYVKSLEDRCLISTEHTTVILKSGQKPEPEKKVDKKPIKPGDIIGKIDVHDTRERRDGPGGN